MFLGKKKKHCRLCVLIFRIIDWSASVTFSAMIFPHVMKGKNYYNSFTQSYDMTSIFNTFSHAALIKVIFHTKMEK